MDIFFGVIFQNILAAIWFFLPVGLANAIPVLTMHMPILKNLNYPLDFGKSLGGIRIFGDHKTFRGLISGIIVGLLVVGLQTWIYSLTTTTNYDGCKSQGLIESCITSTTGPQFPFINKISWVNYSQVNWIVFGFLAGAGPLLGDAMKSFFKRRQNLKPGATWFPFDQIDYILGGIFFTLPIIQLEWWKYLIVGLIWFLLHPMTTFLGYLLKLKDSPI